MVDIKRAHFILFVADQDLSTRFYQRVLELEPALCVPGMTEKRPGTDAPGRHIAIARFHRFLFIIRKERGMLSGH